MANLKPLEEWLPVNGYEGFYEISNFGRLRSIFRKSPLNGTKNKHGYLCNMLYKDGKALSKSHHRLVAEAFIPNPDNKPQVNHTNGVKTDNRVENLEWCNNSENQIHAIDTLGITPIAGIRRIRVIKDGVILFIGRSSRAVEKIVGCPKTTITRICEGRKTKFKKYTFEYAQ